MRPMDPSASPQHTVLVVEPHLPTRELLTSTISQHGYRVLAADEPSRALEQCISERPDALLVAVDLPRYQGATLGKLVRATEAGARVPILAIDKAHLGKAKGVGAILDLMVNGYLADASREQELLARLAQLIAAAAGAPRPTRGIAATLSRAPVLTGELRARTLPTHLYSCYRLQRDGVLVIAHRELARRVYLLKGAPVNYDSNARHDSLGVWLLERGTLTSQAHGEMLGLMRDDALSPGAALVAIGAVEPGEPLLALLRDYARAKIIEAYATPQGRYGFHAGAEFSDEIPTLELAALGPLYHSARGTWPVKAFAAPLAPNMKSYPSRSPDFAQILPSLGLGTGDLKLALTINGHQTLRELLAGCRDLRHSLALLWYLSLVEAVRFERQPTHSAATAGFAIQESAPARRRKPLPEEKANELREEAIRILTASYFRVLGLDITADAEAVEKAFHEVATRFHPETYAEFDLGPIEDLLSSVQDRVSAAYRVLSDGEKRKAYVSYVLSRAEVSRAGTPHPGAEIELKRGENLMKRGDWRGALNSFEQAVSLNPREPEYYSFLAWATFKAGVGGLADRGRAALKLLKKAVAMNPTLERPQVIRAIVEDELGDPGGARRTLLKLLKTNPDSVLAKKTLQGLSKRRGAGERL